MVKKELVNLNVKIPRTLKVILEKYVTADLHTNLSEFTRDALREKIQHDAPTLYMSLFVEKDSKEALESCKSVKT
mgnify:CR=1 FL=1